MKKRVHFSTFTVIFLFAVAVASLTVQADSLSAVNALQRDWAIANYEKTGEEQKKAFEQLIVEANSAVLANAGSAELATWSGIIKSTYAGVKGGLGALSLAKQAKVDLEKAIAIDRTALTGSAMTSLGTLYANVPGWPVGFGDAKKAQSLLREGLELNPDGIDSNYFYAQFLAGKKQYSEAKEYFDKASSAPARTDRPLSDKGRKQDIVVELSKLEKKLK